MAYESDVAGTLIEILAEEGETLPIGSADRAGRRGLAERRAKSTARRRTPQGGGGS